jgi:hypothetical protein
VAIDSGALAAAASNVFLPVLGSVMQQCLLVCVCCWFLCFVCCACCCVANAFEAYLNNL